MSASRDVSSGTILARDYYDVHRLIFDFLPSARDVGRYASVSRFIAQTAREESPHQAEAASSVFGALLRRQYGFLLPSVDCDEAATVRRIASARSFRGWADFLRRGIEALTTQAMSELLVDEAARASAASCVGRGGAPVHGVRSGPSGRVFALPPVGIDNALRDADESGAADLHVCATTLRLAAERLGLIDVDSALLAALRDAAVHAPRSGNGATDLYNAMTVIALRGERLATPSLEFKPGTLRSQVWLQAMHRVNMRGSGCMGPAAVTVLQSARRDIGTACLAVSCAAIGSRSTPSLDARRERLRAAYGDPRRSTNREQARCEALAETRAAAAPTQWVARALGLVCDAPGRHSSATPCPCRPIRPTPLVISFQLQELLLADQHIGPSGLAALHDLATTGAFPSLRALNLANNRLLPAAPAQMYYDTIVLSADAQAPLWPDPHGHGAQAVNRPQLLRLMFETFCALPSLAALDLARNELTTARDVAGIFFGHAGGMRALHALAASGDFNTAAILGAAEVATSDAVVAAQCSDRSPSFGLSPVPHPAESGLWWCRKAPSAREGLTIRLDGNPIGACGSAVALACLASVAARLPHACGNAAVLYATNCNVIVDTAAALAAADPGCVGPASSSSRKKPQWPAAFGPALLARALGVCAAVATRSAIVVALDGDPAAADVTAAGGAASSISEMAVALGAPVAAATRGRGVALELGVPTHNVIGSAWLDAVGQNISSRLRGKPTALQWVRGTGGAWRLQANVSGGGASESVPCVLVTSAALAAPAATAALRQLQESQGVGAGAGGCAVM
jgi:hypothetical protein